MYVAWQAVSNLPSPFENGTHLFKSLDPPLYSEWIYVSFNLNELTPLPPLGGIHERKGEGKEMFTTNKKITRCKVLACPVALKYGLKDSPYFTEWIKLCVKCIIWTSVEPLHDKPLMAVCYHFV